MASIKFEEHIKEKLDKREIIPSDKAWGELSAQFEPSRGRWKMRFLKIGIAASTIGLLILSMVYYNAGRQLDKEGNKIVDAPRSVIVKKPGDFPDENKVEEQVAIIAAKGGSEIVETDANKKVNKIIGDISEGDFTNEDKLANVVAFEDTIEPEMEEKELLDPNSMINAKIEEVVAQVNLMEENNIFLTHAEVDSLLQKAQQELFSEKIFRDNHSVDAMALLADVEGELDHSFREQIFDMLKEGYFKVKTAVAPRNN